MKYLFVIVSIGISINILGQETCSDSNISSKLFINTIKNNSLEISLNIDFTKEYTGYEIDDETFEDLNSNCNFKLIAPQYPTLTNKGEKISLNISPKGIVFSLTNISDGLMNLLRDSIAGIYIQTNSDILLEIKKSANPATSKIIKISSNQIEKKTRNKLVLTKSMAQELIDAKVRNIFLSQNQIDIGIIPAENASSKTTEYTASFTYRSSYSFSNKNFPVFFSAKGLISTNSKDSLNYLSIYPVNYNFLQGGNELTGQVGIEGNQVFSSYRISGNFFWNGIIPNLIDLTYGEDRLRLKPVITLGLKLYKEIKNNRAVELQSKEFSNQLYCEYYYYIPIQKIYSLKLEGSAFYDFSTKVNPNKNIMFNYSIILGIDIPKTDFKTIFKYVKGKNGISFEKNEYLMIGLMMDLISTK